MAHGREEILQFNDELAPRKNSGGYLDLVEAEWEGFCNVENARRCCEDVHSVAADLSERTGTSISSSAPFGAIASGTYRVEDHPNS